MKKWPLRWKIASYAAILGIIATIAGAITTWVVMHFCELAALDKRLASEAREVFALLDRTKPTQLSDALNGLNTRDRFLELNDAAGRLLYRSGTTQRAKFHRAENSYRTATFRHGNYALHVGADLTEINRLSRDIVFGMFAAIPTVLVVVTLGGKWIARQALGPVEAIRAAAAGITIHNLSQRLPKPAASDEIAGLVDVLNCTFDHLQRSFEQSVRFSADASHQLKTPLTILRAGIEEMLTDPAASPKQETCAEALLHQVHQLTSLVENLLLLARADARRLNLSPHPFDLNEVLDGMCDDTRALAEANGLSVTFQAEPELLVIADRASTSLITQNLVENAIKYNACGGKIDIKAQKIDGHVEVIIGNDGEGIPTNRREGLFGRFYRLADQSIEGKGLGLAVARELAQAQGGDVTLVTSEGNWTEFQLRLPSANTT